MRRRIAHITDLHLDEEFPISHGIKTRDHLDTILKDIAYKGIKEIICTGDIGEHKGIEYFFEQAKDYDLSITLGNHDSYAQIYKHFKKGALQRTEKFYSSNTDDHLKFIFLDSSDDTIDNEQLTWLSVELSSSKPIVIFTHHPILGLNLKVDEMGSLKNQHEVRALLETVPVDVTIFCGHYHMDSSSTHGSIHQHITPAISFQIEKSPYSMEIDTTTFGYRIIELEEEKISSRIQLFKSAD